MSVLTAGLFSHLDDREVPCKVEGCENTWTWSAEEQIRAFGQPPPKRMCADHLVRFHALEDREVPCANPGCDKTWHFAKAAQLALLEKTGSAELPARLCDDCRRAERELGDVEVPCRIETCRRTWRWTRDAQLKHRAWLRRQAGEAVAPDRETAEVDEPAKRRRRRKRRRAATEGPPRRLCDVCKRKLDMLIEREVVCKVHGCTRTVLIDRESQLRAWVALETTDLEAEAPLPKRMCDVCREFCRLHADREVPCGRPGCDRTWTHKTGAQLQAFLAGRLEDPVRLCDECSKMVPAGTSALEVEPGVEIMPCVVPGCDGVWLFAPGMTIAPAEDGDLPLDRMCDPCRVIRGESPRRVPPPPDAGEPPPAEAASTSVKDP